MTFKKYKEWVLKDPKSKKLVFDPDGRLHYVYRITELFGDGLHYYGSRTDSDEPRIGRGYYTSSTNKEFRCAFEKTPKNYKVKVICIFDNTSDKMLFESYLHFKFNVKDSPFFINLSNQMPWGFDCTGIKRSPETKKRMSEAQIKFNAEIASDPVRYERRQQRQSISSKKREQLIKQNPLKLEKRRKRMSTAAKINNHYLKEDEERYAKKVEKNRKATTKSQAEILADPERALKRHIKLSKASSKTVYEYDLDGNFIREFSSQVKATEFYNIKNKSGINHCITGRQKTCNGSIWKLENTERTDRKESKWKIYLKKLKSIKINLTLYS